MIVCLIPYYLTILCRVQKLWCVSKIGLCSAHEKLATHGHVKILLIILSLGRFCLFTQNMIKSCDRKEKGEFCLLEYNACSPVKVIRHFGGTCRLHLQGRRVSQWRYQHEAGSKEIWLLLPSCCVWVWGWACSACFILLSWLVHSSILKMEATCSSKVSVDFQRTTRCYIPENRTLHNHCCVNLKSYQRKVI
jgi:hypothetical protein